MKFEEIYKQMEDVEGWMGKPDCLKLYEYACKVKGTIVEIGSYLGRSTKLLALSSPKSKIIAIDPYKNERFATESYDNESVITRSVANTKRKFSDNVKGLSVRLIVSTGKKAGRVWNEPIDLLHIDGSHLYKDVLEDINLFVPHVKKGCYVFLHDYNVRGEREDYQPEKHGVSKAVNELKDNYFDEVLTSDFYFGFAICRKK